MKQHFFSKGGLLLVFMSTLLSFIACRKDQFWDNSKTPTPDGGNVTVQEAKQFYDNTLIKLRDANIESSKTDAQFTALDFTPDWSIMLTHNKNGKTFFEVPLKFKNNTLIASGASSTATKFNALSDVQVPTRLIISKSNDGVFKANIMLFRSISPYENGVVPDFNLFKKINNFTGQEYSFNLDGSFNKGWHHKNGEITKTFTLSKYGSQRQQATPRGCTGFYSYNMDTGEIVQIFWVICEVEDGGSGGCTAWCEGWGSGNGGGGGDNSGSNNNPPSDCTGTSGLKAYGFGSVSFFSLDLTGDGEPDGECASISYDCRITVSNCPSQIWSPAELTYKTHEKWLYPGSFSSTNHSMVPGRTESVNVAFPRSGFKSVVYCSANASFTLWVGPFGGIPKNANFVGDANFYVL